MLSVLDVLKGTRELLADPEHWTQGFSALDQDEAPVDPLDKTAYCFCLDGALARASGGYIGNYHQAAQLLNDAVPDGLGGYVDFNDEHDHGEVIEFLDTQIKELSDA